MTADGEKAAWDGRRGSHIMEIRQAVTRIPRAKPEIVAGQIHGDDDDLVLIHLSGRELRVTYLDDNVVELDPDHQLGTPFTVRLVGTDGRTQVFYNGEKKFDEAISAPKNYFKTGSYCRSDPERTIGTRPARSSSAPCRSATTDIEHPPSKLVNETFDTRYRSGIPS